MIRITCLVDWHKLWELYLPSPFPSSICVLNMLHKTGIREDKHSSWTSHEDTCIDTLFPFFFSRRNEENHGVKSAFLSLRSMFGYNVSGLDLRLRVQCWSGRLSQRSFLFYSLTKVRTLGFLYSQFNFENVPGVFLFFDMPRNAIKMSVCLSVARLEKELYSTVIVGCWLFPFQSSLLSAWEMFLLV